VLAAIGALVRASLRGSDVKVRYGGEEFLLILPDTPAAGGRQLAETLRGLIGRARVPVGHTELTVTASVGVTTATDDEQAEAVIARADRALYEAKRAGRDRVCVAEAPPVRAGQPEARRQRDTRRASGV
jgi:diguanylate cyclase (GGDEF)-like protein